MLTIVWTFLEWCSCGCADGPSAAVSFVEEFCAVDSTLSGSVASSTGVSLMGALLALTDDAVVGCIVI